MNFGSEKKWNNQSRFEPESVLGTVNKNVSWDKTQIVPNIQRPTEFKSGRNESKIINVTYTGEVSNQIKWQLKLKTTSKPSGGSEVVAQVIKEYFWYKRDPDLNVDLFVEKEFAAAYADVQGMDSQRRRISDEVFPGACILIDPTKADHLKSLRINLKSIQMVSGVLTVTTSNPHNLSVNDDVFIKDIYGNVDVYGVFKVLSVASPTQFSVEIESAATPSQSGATPTQIPLTDVSNNFGICFKVIDFPTKENLTVERFVERINKSQTIQVLLRREFEELKARRAAIGIRDIYIGKETYENRAQVISKPFYVSGNLDLVSLYAADYIPDSNSLINYSISVDGGVTFFPIQPVERNYTVNGPKEILAFNQNLSADDQLPQVQYLNNGKDRGVPNPINSIIVKIEIAKDSSSSNTPVVYYYKVGTRYR